MRAIHTAFLALACAMAPAAALAQASITGSVKDSSGAVLPGVTVEATSDVLIEKVRTAATDSNGRFQLVDLRPGAYVVTFTLPGFNTHRRDGVVLTGASTVAVDAELRVGALEETVTVTGESPIVDVQTTTRSQVLNAEVIDALPTARSYTTLARMIPGTMASGAGSNDVGGSLLQDVGGSVTVHGSRTVDQRVTLNGISTMTLQAGGNIGGQIPDLGSASEVTVDTSSLSADLPTGGVRINFIPRDGGNTFRNATFFTFSNNDLQGDNFSDDLRAAGLPTPNRIVKNWDLNESVGGPLQRDRLWFWFSARYNGVENEVAVFQNRNAFDPTQWLYAEDSSRPGVNKGRSVNSSLRVTWQASPRNKIAGTYKADRWCACPNFISATRAPEAGADRRFPRLRQEHLEWTSPVNNNLLLEAVGMHLYERWGNMHLRVKGGSLDDPAQEAAQQQLIAVLEQTSNMTYRTWTEFTNTVVPNYAYRAALSYITGTHNVKVGFNRTHGYQRTFTYTPSPVSYRFNNGVPNRITQRATPRLQANNADNDIGVFVQDRWTMDRLTVSGAIRYDYFGTSFPEQHIGPGPLVPNRNITFPAQDNLGFKDVSYRSGATYDLRGNGKTALKVAFNKYLLGQTLNGLGNSPNPVNALVNTANRTWTDANRNFRPDCDLLNPNTQDTRASGGDFCAGLDNIAFGTTQPGETFDPDLLRGYGHRMRNWELSASVQHEVISRVSVDVGYFRRVWGNFQVTDNLLVGPGDFDYFDVTAPMHAELPGGGGYAIKGVRNVKSGAFGLEQNYNTLSDKYGTQIEHWNGFDVTVDARLRNGLVLQGGVSTGKTTEDNCEIVAQLPEMNIDRPLEFCRRETPFLTQVKAYGIYTVPRVGVQVAGTFRSTPGGDINANLTATNAFLGTNSTLGRPLSGSSANMTIGLLSPNSKYLDRRNELDLRFGKVLRTGRNRAVVSVDLFNALNSDALVSANQTFATWLRPTEILNARLVKFSVQYDF